MNISAFGKNISFGSVYAVTSGKDDAKEMKKLIARTPGYGCVIDITALYKREFADEFESSTNSSKCVNLVVTGHDDFNKVMRVAKGWRTDAEIAEHITDFVEIRNVKSDISPIQKAMKF